MNPGTTASRSRTVLAEDIERFTAMTGDRNPLHYDAELAAATRFGGIVVQGGVTTGLLNALVAEDLPGPGSVFLHTDWSYRARVRPGDTITATVEVLERRAPDKPITNAQHRDRQPGRHRRRRRHRPRLVRAAAGSDPDPLNCRFRQLFAHAAGIRPSQQRVDGSGHRPGRQSSGAV